MYVQQLDIAVRKTNLYSGSSGSVRYDSLSSGTYVFRIVARAANGEKDIERRKIHIGMYDCMAVFVSAQVVK